MRRQTRYPRLSLLLVALIIIAATYLDASTTNAPTFMTQTIERGE